MRNKIITSGPAPTCPPRDVAIFPVVGRDVFVGGMMQRRGGEMATHRDGPAVFDVVNLIVKNHTTSNAVF